MHSIMDAEELDKKLLAEQIAEANRLRPLLWLLVFIAPLGLILGLLFGIAIGGW
ncbi:MAG: hypothetical protein J0I20_11825 [Chloroflexi bacterium]|nr:hypothetical protein [Chloroflexota bacterium]